MRSTFGYNVKHPNPTQYRKENTMVLLNITLDQKEILQILSENSGVAFKKI